MDKNVYNKLINSISKLKNPDKAKLLSRYFKTGKGEYGEGDVFYGITVPLIREQVKVFYNQISLEEVTLLLKDNVHEVRMCGALILVKKYEKAKIQEDKYKIFSFYCENLSAFNNWDLVDLSCHQIIGDYLLKYRNSNIDLLRRLSNSDNVWERRISAISTFEFIRNKNLEIALEISERLLFDKQDIINKAVGWMLREIGKRNFEYELAFVKKYNTQMPRTTLRYAIEKFPEKLRQELLLKT